MLVKDQAKTCEERIQLAQLAAHRMSATLLKVAENLENGWGKDIQVSIIKQVAKDLQDDMTEWMVS